MHDGNYKKFSKWLVTLVCLFPKPGNLNPSLGYFWVQKDKRDRGRSGCKPVSTSCWTGATGHSHGTLQVLFLNLPSISTLEEACCYFLAGRVLRSPYTLEKWAVLFQSLPGAQSTVSPKFYESEAVGADGEQPALSHLQGNPHFHILNPQVQYNGTSMRRTHFQDQYILCHGPPWEHLADVSRTQSLAKGPLMTQLQCPGLLHDPGWGHSLTSATPELVVMYGLETGGRV